MKKQYIWLLCVLAIAVISGCKKEQKDIFDKNATERVTERVEEVHKTLQANKNGWLIKYFPSSTVEFGGYTIFAKFTSDTDVTLASDISEGNSVSSKYAVIPETGALLTFNTFNKILHYFSEPGADSGEGAVDSGMKGDFEFIVLEVSAEKILLKGKKTGNLMEMTPLSTSGDKTIEDYQEEFEMFSKAGVFILEKPDKTTEELNVSYRTFQLADDANGELMSFRVVPGGLEFYKEFNLFGVKSTKLKYVQPSSGYDLGYYTDEASTFKIILKATPLNRWFRNNLWSVSYKNMGALGKLYWDFGRPMLKEKGITLNNFYIGKNGSDGAIIWALQGGTVVGGLTHIIRPKAGTEDQVFIQLEGYGVGTFVLAHWQGGLNYLSAPFDGSTFKITSDGTLKPAVIMLTDIADSRNTFKLTLGDIDDPLNN